MKRSGEIADCRNLIANQTPDHLHIRKKAIVATFTENLRNDLQEDYKVVSIDLSEWDYDEVMTTLRWELQKELSTIRYRISKLTSFTASVFGTGGGATQEKSPDYSRATTYLQRVADQTDEHLVLFINHHGEKPVNGFGWVSKLGDLPDNTTLLTHGFQRCERERSAEYEIGRLNEDQTIDYLTTVRDDINESEAAVIHRIHDGNPIAIELALEQGQLKEPLSGDELETLWSSVYDDKLSAEERDLLHGSSHLIDLDYRDVTMTVGKTRGECKEILRSLESKGVVSEERSGLFTADKYVKRYIRSQLVESELSENHRTSFKNYAEKWVDSYESQMKELRSVDEEELPQNKFFADESNQSFLDPNLYLAIHQLSNIHAEMDKDAFIEELEGVDAAKTGVFVFGVYAQRFFFENPTEVIGDLAKSLLGIEDDFKTDVFSGTFDILLNFDAKAFVSELANGWSGDINTDELKSNNIPNPDKMVESLQRGMNSNLYQGLPSEVKLAIAHILVLAYSDSRNARDYYNRFGKTAERYGLDEEPFCEWLDELGTLIDIMSPDSDAPDEDTKDPLESNLEMLHSEIRNRTELKQQLKENRSEAQQQFQRRIEKIRNRPNEVVNQYLRCGEALAQTSNSLFPYLWYAFGDNVFAEIVLGKRSGEIYGEYRYWAAKRETHEADFNEEDLVVSIDEIDSAFGDLT